MKFSHAILIFLVVVLANCHVRPAPEDVTSLRSSQIVRQIRCEAREAIQTIAWEELEKLRPLETKRYEHDPKKFTRIPEIFTQLSLKERENFSQYDGTQIAYDFRFDISEGNNLSGGIDLLSGFRRGTTKSGLDLTTDRTRQSIQSFRIYDTAEGLVLGLKDKDCDDQLANENAIYPIAGKVELLKVFRNFFDLNETNNLVVAGPEVQAYTETVQFTTKLSGKVAPAWVLGPLGRSTNIVGADFSLETKRDDIHRLIVVITIPIEKKVKTAGGQVKRVRAESKEDQKTRTLLELNDQIRKQEPVILRPQ